MSPANSQCLAQESTIHAHVGPGDKTCCPRTRQKHHRSTQLLGGPESSHRGVAEDGLGTSGGTAVLVEKKATILLSRKEARRDGVDPYPARGPFACQELGEAQNGRLGR